MVKFFHRVTLPFSGDAGQQPCNFNGGSPLLPIACSRFTGLLLTGRGQCYRWRFGSAPLEQTATGSTSPHRVEQPSPGNTTKGNSTASPLSCLNRQHPGINPLTTIVGDLSYA